MGDNVRRMANDLQRSGISFIGQQPAFFREGWKATDREIVREARLRKSLCELTLTSLEEAEALRKSCPLALDSLVRQLASGDREWWGWVEKKLDEIRA